MTQQNSDGQMCCASYRVGNVTVKARLLETHAGLQKQYSIVLQQEDECKTCEVGSNFVHARALFLRVVFGGVTVCTLQDVVEDVRAALV